MQSIPSTRRKGYCKADEIATPAFPGFIVARACHGPFHACSFLHYPTVTSNLMVEIDLINCYNKLIDYFYPKTGFNRKEDEIMITMNKGRQYIAWLIAFMILFSAFSPLNVALAAKPDTLDADVSVTGVEDSGTINGSTGIEITVTFPVPVMGDGVTDYFEHGDSVTLLLSESFKFDPVPTGSFDLMYGTKKTGDCYTEQQYIRPSRGDNYI